MKTSKSAKIGLCKAALAVLTLIFALSFTGCANPDSNEPKTPIEKEPEIPTDPKDPVDPKDPADPVDPPDPQDPVDPVDPQDPVDPVDPQDPIDPDEPIEQKAQAITSFTFLKEDTGRTADMIGAINQQSRTITFTSQVWIDNIEKLTAVFTLDDTGSVFVNGARQQSGITPNDFRKEMVYRLNENVAYRVSIVSPQASGLPVIRIDTVNSAPIADKVNWVTMTFTLSDPNDSTNDIPDLSNQQIRGRGNSTWSDTPGAKNPYRIRFRDAQQQSPFGLPQARNWVLLRSGAELNNSFGFELGKRLNLQYTCSYNHVQLYINGDYRGAYLFTEHRQADPAGLGAPGRPKVDLNEGWFVEIDRRHDEEPRFRTNNYNLPLMIKTPEDESNLSMSNPIYQFVRNDWNQIADLMASNSFPENGYRDLVDFDTFAKYFIVQTIIKNNDLFRPRAETGEEIGSTFFFKDKGGLISAGPLWDLDWSFAPWEFEGREFLPDTVPYQIHPWFRRFHDDPLFQVRYKEIWNKNFQANILTMSGFLESLGAKIRAGALENKKRWPDGTDIDWHISHNKDYFAKRAAYLNTEYNKVDVRPVEGKFGSTAAQKFTLVAFGEMTELSAAFQNGELSSFEIAVPLNQSPAGDGGFLAAVTIKPKAALASGTHTDVLVLSGRNQGKTFTHNVELNYTSP